MSGTGNSTRPYFVALTVSVMVEVVDPEALEAQAATDPRVPHDPTHQGVQLIQNAVEPYSVLPGVAGIKIRGGSVYAQRAGFRR